MMPDPANKMDEDTLMFLQPCFSVEWNLGPALTVFFLLHLIKIWKQTIRTSESGSVLSV